MDAFGQLTVHKAALTSVSVPRLPQNDRLLTACLGVWADLSEVIAAGDLPRFDPDLNMLSVLHTVDAYLMPDRIRIALVVTQRPESGEDEETAEGSAAVESPRYTLILPVAAVGLVVALSSTPTMFRLVLVDGPPPEDPEHAVLDLDAVAGVILVDPEHTYEALHDVVPDDLRQPLPFDGDEEAGGTFVDSMRGLLWSMISGVALGQVAAFNRLIEFGEFAHRLAAAEDPDLERVAAIAEVAGFAQEISRDHVAESEIRVDLDALPEAMTGLRASIDERVPVTALLALSDGVPFPTVASEHGLHQALPALGVLIAQRAHATRAFYEDGSTLAWIIGMWLQDEDDDPWWALLAAGPGLAHHDTAAIADLLSYRPDDDSQMPGPLLHQYLHMLAEALLALDMDQLGFAAALGGLEVQPVNFADAAGLATTLLEEGLASTDREDGLCPACAALTPVLGAEWEVGRLARAAAVLLPCLADLAAEDDGLPVGEQEWVSYRTEFLTHWLRTSAAA